MKKLFIIIILLSVVVIMGCSKESADLKALKQALKTPYNPVIQKTQKGQITAFNTVDKNQQKALSIILTSTASDITPWLKEHIGEYAPIYLYAMANRRALIDKAPVKDILFWANAANIRAAADRQLCKDKFVGQYLTILNIELIQPITAVYGQEVMEVLHNEQEFKEIVKEAAEWDKQHPQTNSPAWICSSGHGVSTAETFPPEEWEKIRADFKKEYTASVYK